MARLFVTTKELDFISDINKEIIKDVNGQVIYLYPISEVKTISHEVYDETINKIFDNPIAIDAMVDAQFHDQTEIQTFGVDAKFKIEVFIQYVDLIDKGINIQIGDYFSFSSIMYEIVDKTTTKNIYGLPERKNSVKLIGIHSRESNFKNKFIGPTDIMYSDNDATQKTFVQQRGFSQNKFGETADSRALINNGLLELPIDGPREVSPNGDTTNTGSAFYDE